MNEDLKEQCTTVLAYIVDIPVCVVKVPSSHRRCFPKWNLIHIFLKCYNNDRKIFYNNVGRLPCGKYDLCCLSADGSTLRATGLSGRPPRCPWFSWTARCGNFGGRGQPWLRLAGGSPGWCWPRPRCSSSPATTGWPGSLDRPELVSHLSSTFQKFLP